MTILNDFKNISDNIINFFSTDPIIISNKFKSDRDKVIKLIDKKITKYIEDNNILELQGILSGIRSRVDNPFNISDDQLYMFSSQEIYEISVNAVNNILNHYIETSNKEALNKVVPYIQIDSNYENIIKPLIEKKDFDTLLILTKSPSLMNTFLINLSDYRQQLLKDNKFQEIVDNYNLVKANIETKQKENIRNSVSTDWRYDNKESLIKYFEDHYNTLKEKNNDLYNVVYVDCINNNDINKLNEMIKVDPDFNQKIEDLIQIAIKLDNSEALKTIIISMKLDINDKKFYSENDIILPKTLFNVANENNAVKCMQFAIKYNNEPFTSNYFNFALYNAVEKNKEKSVEFLMRNYSKDYADEFLNDLEKKATEASNINIATMIKTIRLNVNTMVPKSVVLDKINVLKNNLLSNTTEIKNTM